MNEQALHWLSLTEVAARLRGTRYNAERGLLCAEGQPAGRPCGLSPLAGEGALSFR